MQVVAPDRDKGLTVGVAGRRGCLVFLGALSRLWCLRIHVCPVLISVTIRYGGYGDLVCHYNLLFGQMLSAVFHTYS